MRSEPLLMIAAVGQAVVRSGNRFSVFSEPKRLTGLVVRDRFGIGCFSYPSRIIASFGEAAYVFLGAWWVTCYLLKPDASEVVRDDNLLELRHEEC